ncbi:MAG: response regulator [Deltaproteobacteria bacterium]|nr:response regulator [Deltaproteobacteria bacterium]
MAATVLIIDQDEEFASQLEEVLQGVGLEVSLTNDGKKGMDLAMATPPAAIILCVELQKMSGYSVCAKIKKDNALKAVPVIITSSEATPEVFEQHKKLKSRAEEYLKKPFPPAMLIEVLKNYIGDLMVQPHSEEAAVDIVEANDPVEFEDSTPPEQLQGQGDAIEEETAGTGLELGHIAPGALEAALGGTVGMTDTGEAPAYEEAQESEALTTVGFPSPLPSRPPPRDTGASAELARLRALVAELEDRASQISAERDQAIANVSAARAEADAAMSMRPQAGSTSGAASREVVELKKERVQKEKEIIRLREELNAKENERMAWLEKETELDGKIVELEESLELEKANRSQVEAKLAGELARLTGLEQSHGQAVEDFRRRLQEASDREAELNQRLEETQATLEETHASLGASSEHAEQLGLRVAELEQEGEQLRGVIVERDNEIAELRAKGTADEEEINRLRGELEGMTLEAQNLSGQLAAKTEEANGLLVDKASLEERLETTHEELESFRERTGQLEEEREQTQAFISGAEDRRFKALKALEIATALLHQDGTEAGLAEAEVIEDADLVEAEAAEATA